MSRPDPRSDEHRQAQLALLEGLRRGHDLGALQHAVRQTTSKTFSPDVAMLDLAVRAMDVGGVERSAPLLKSELISQHLPEINFRNQRALQERTTYAINAAAAIRGGLEPDILEDMYWWHTRDIVEYAVTAAVAYVRACADRRGIPVASFVTELEPLVQEHGE